MSAINLAEIAHEGCRARFLTLTTLHHCTPLGEGFSSTVVETASGIVFRLARNPAAGERYAKEAINLPLLFAPFAGGDPATAVVCASIA